jgi:hypothetical protein
MLTVTDFDVLQAAGCIQCAHGSMHELWVHLLAATELDPCTTGCAAFDGGACPCYRQYRATTPRQVGSLLDATNPHNGTGEWAGLSMKQIAAKEGISLGEARKRKREGHYA